MTKLAVVALDGYTDSGLAVALDVFRAANALGARAGSRHRFALEVLSPSKQVRSASGLAITAQGGLSRLSRCEVALVPGCWMEEPSHVDRMLARADVQATARALAALFRRGGLVGASCSGTFVLASTGLLDGRRATTTWWLAEAFRRRFPRVRLEADQALVAEGRLLCAGTVFAMADLALAVVARRAGPALARQCMRALLLDQHASQAPYMVLRQMVLEEPLVLEAERWVRRHLAEPFSVPALAKAIGASPRTLARRLEASVGTGPLGFIHRVRLEAATHLLRSSTASLDDVAARVGYRDAGTLRRLIRRNLGVAAGALRRRAEARAR